MIDNGAGKSPLSLPAHLRYCAFTNTMPKERPSSRRFSVIGNGIQSSMGVVTIRMPQGKNLMLSFDVDLINQEILLIFGLDLLFAYHCSSNEYTRTFTHHPSQTTISIQLEHQANSAGGHISSVPFTRIELRKLHKQIRHTANESFVRLLEKEACHSLSPEMKSEMNEIVKNVSHVRRSLHNLLDTEC